jgi:hypothetical protein
VQVRKILPNEEELIGLVLVGEIFKRRLPAKNIQSFRQRTEKPQLFGKMPVLSTKTLLFIRPNIYA